MVYRAVQRALGRQVAVKILSQEAGDDQDFVQRFEKEGQFLAQMLHTNIITIYDIGFTEESQPFLSVEYLPGGTLKDRIKQGLSLDSAIEIISAIAKALAYTHERGVIHRDIKPSNIMFRRDGTPVLTDFGIARSVEAKTVHTIAGLTLGSPGYMSPEQVMGEVVTLQSDIYGLGVVFYEMLTGHPLYEGGNPMAVMLKHLHDPIPELPKEYTYLQPIFQRLIAKKSEDRYKNVIDFLRALNLVVSGDTGLRTKVNPDIHNVSLVDFASSKIRHSFGKKSRFFWMTGFAFFLIVSAYIFISTDLSNHNVEPAKPIVKIEPDQILQEVTVLLKSAESQLQAGHLTNESDQGSAEATYRRVLRLDPGNAQALEGLQNIAGEYEKRAQQRLDAGALQDSLDHIHQGLAVVPGHHGLMPLYAKVKQLLAEDKARLFQAEEQRQRRLQSEYFMTQAQESLREGSMEVGLAYVEQGLLAVPDHRELLALREQVRTQMAERQRQAEARQRQEQEAGRKIEAARRKQEADRYLASALDAQHKGEYSASLQHLERGLALAPDHDELTRLRDKVRGQFAAEQQRQADQAQREQQIRTLLEQAETHLEAKRLTTPAGNNAEETYRQLLNLDPGNAQAQAGFGRIVQEYERLAQQRRAAGALQDSLAQIDKGLAIMPTHEGLQRLRQDIGAEWEAEQQRLEQKRKEQDQQRLEQKRKEQEQQRLDQKRKEQEQEQQRLDQKRKEQEQQRLEQKRKEQEQQRKEQDQQQRLEQQRKEQEQQRKEQQRLERQQDQQRKEPPRAEPQPQPPRKEPPSEKPSPPETTAKPRVFGTF